MNRVLLAALPLAGAQAPFGSSHLIVTILFQGPGCRPSDATTGAITLAG